MSRNKLTLEQVLFILHFLNAFSSLFIDIVKGITTLRAFGTYLSYLSLVLYFTHTRLLGFVHDDIRKNARLLTSSQRPSYLLLMIQEWLNVVLNFVVMLMAVGLTAFAVRFHSNSALAGAALYSLLSFGENLAGIVLFWTKLETSLGAIARLKTFNETVKPEDRDGEDADVPEQWPHRGVVELSGVSAQYGYETGLYVDHNQTLTILIESRMKKTRSRALRFVIYA